MRYVPQQFVGLRSDVVPESDSVLELRTGTRTRVLFKDSDSDAKDRGLKPRGIGLGLEPSGLRPGAL